MSKQNTQIQPPTEVQPPQGFENVLVAVDVPVMVHIGSDSEHEPVVATFFTRMYYPAQVDVQQMQQMQQAQELEQLQQS
ncbi:hypothetical protein N7466_006326 [Penicillium verhagenii]|uniref:uncharacterized protein n=1 Tax=Penicillium verhagenii TaxID=1562060 RepID=UPI0025456B29|nr:uncharacterized protein N7466_006326 [Penicillium verhagenii]KAJ5930833.1 hypothetical protein N7466_006326 [Penicillium verhagenii]